MAIDVNDVVERASAVLAELRGLDLDGVGDDTLTDAVLSVQRLRGALEVAEARVLSRWDAQGAWRPSGAKSPAAWLAWRQHLPIGITRQRMRHARALRDLPAVEEAWGTGDIDRSHVTTLLGARNPRTAQAFDRDHKELVDIARDSWFSHFKIACDRWSLVIDPDGAEQDAKDDRAARALHLAESFGGMWFGKITLDPISGTIVNETLQMIERELFEADWADAKARLGRDPLIADLARTPAQRRADALIEMAVRARTAPAGGRRPAPLFTVVVGLDTLNGPILELINRTILTPGQAAEWLTEADVERIVFDGPSRSATAPASTPPATKSPNAPRPTTSTKPPTAARPPKTTADGAAHSTTAGAPPTPTPPQTTTPTQPSPTADTAGHRKGSDRRRDGSRG